MPADVEQLIREAMARRAADAPAASGLSSAARTRVRVRRRVLAGAVTLVTASIAVVATLWLTNRDAEDMTATPTEEQVPLPTSGWSDGDPGHLALFQGRLHVTDEGCAYGVRENGDTPMGLLWPEGWTAQTGDSGFAVVNPEGQVILQSGDAFGVGGAVHDPGDVCGLGTFPIFAMEARPEHGPG